MKDTRGSELALPHFMPDALEKEVIHIKHSQFWKELESELERIIGNTREALMTKLDFTLDELRHLQGVYSMAKKIKEWPEVFLSRNKQENSKNE